MEYDRKVELDTLEELKRLRQQVAQWEATFDSIPDLVALISPNLQIIRLNKTGYEIVGKKPDEVIGKKCYEVLHGLDAPIDGCLCKDVMATKTPRVAEITQSGKHCIATASPVLNENNQVSLCVHTLKDITERKKAEQTLQNSERQYRLLADNASDVIWTADMSPHFTYVSPSAKHLIGYNAEEVKQLRPEQILTPASFLVAMRALEEERSAARKTGKGFRRRRTLELELNCKDHSTVWTETKISYLRDTHEKPIEISGVTRDITLQKIGEERLADHARKLTVINRQLKVQTQKAIRAEEGLRDSERRYRTLFEGAAEGILVVDIETKQFKYANPAICQMLGYTGEELAGMAVADIHLREDLDYVLSEFEAQARGERALSQGIRCLRKDGTIIHADIVAAKVILDGRECNVGFFTDITERKKMENALAEKTHDLRERVKELGCLYGISHLVEKEGISLDEILKGTVNLIPPSWQYPEVTCARIFLGDQEFKTENFKETAWKQTSDITVEGKKAGTVEVFCLQGRRKSYEGSFLKKERRLINAVAEQVGRVIERKKAEERLRSSERRLRILIESAPDGIYLHDLKGTFVNGNRATEKLVGYKREELIGKSFLELQLLPQDQISNAAANLARNAKGEPTGPEEFTLNRKDGRQIIVEIRTYPIEMEGKPLVLSIARDVSERKRTEESVSLLSAAMKTSIDAMAVVSPVDGKLVFCNDAFRKQWKVNGAYRTLSFLDCFEATPQSGGLERVFEGTRKRGWAGELWARAMDGETFPVLAASSPVRNKDGNTLGVLGVFKDISQLKHAEKQIRQYTRELAVKNEQLRTETQKAKEADRLKSEFLASMSHEVRTPLSTIKGAAYLLNQDSLSEEQKKLCSMIRDSGEQLLRIINDILDLARIEAGQARLEEKEFYLKELVEKAVFGFELQAKGKGLELNIIYPSDLPLKIRADEGKLTQVLSNLVDNALKFTQRGRVEVKLEKLADFKIQLQVKDTGIGISEEKFSRIFEKFYQADGTSRRKYEGTGLGLTVVRELAKLMRGKIVVRSTLGKGSSFSFTFPYGSAKRRTVRAEDQVEPKTKQKVRKKLSILIAEDDDAGYYIMQSLLGDYATTRAVDGREVLEKINERDYDLVLMDIQMPQMDGFQATRKIRKKNSTLPIIALTAKAMKGDRDRCLEAGCSDYLSKPIEPEKLLAKVDQYLRERLSRKQNGPSRSNS